jgi:hypothetical protein
MFGTKRLVVLAKLETTEGQDAQPAAADFIATQNVSVNPQGENLEKDEYALTLSKSANITGKKWTDISFDMDFKGSGTVGTAPALGKLLKACAMKETINKEEDVPVSVSYKPSSQNIPSLTFYVYRIDDNQNVVLQKITGARGTFNFGGEAGQFAKISFSFSGQAKADSAGSFSDIQSVVDSEADINPLIVENAAFDFGDAGCLYTKSITFDIGNSVTQRESVCANGGLLSFVITDRNPTGQFKPELQTISTINFQQIWYQNHLKLLTLELGSVAGNKAGITVPKAQVQGSPFSDSNGVVTQDISYKMVKDSTGDDEIEITFF